MVSYDELKKQIEALIDPGYNKTIGEVKGLKKLVVGPTGIVEVEIALKVLDNQDQTNFKIELNKLVKLKLNFPGIKSRFVLNDFMIKGEKKITYIGIASGKGGVGKSTVTANLAYALSLLGKKVGIIDADVYGASIADIFDIADQRPTSGTEDKMIPPKALGIEIISTNFFIEKDQPVMWRGPMLGKLLNHYFYGVLWQEGIDYVLVDLPPGTGDTALDIQKYAPQTEMIIITTPHLNASSVALKAGLGAKKIGHKLLGVVENMSYYLNPVNREKDYVFGQGGGLLISQKLEIPLLASIPLNAPKKGSLYKQDEAIGQIFLKLAEKVISLL